MSGDSLRLAACSGIRKNMDPELTGILRRAFAGCTVESCEELQGGLSCRTSAAQLALADGGSRRVVVRRPRHHAPAEALRVLSCEQRVLSSCADLGIPAPKPCFLDTEAAALVVEYVDGTPDFAPQHERNMLQQLATQLARIHQVRPAAELALLHRNSSAGREIEHVPERFDELLDEQRIRAELGRLWPWPQHNRDCLLHGDYWPGNVLWRDGKLVAVIDWEEAEVGDPLADIAIARLDLLWAFGLDAMERFTQYYREQTALDWRNLPRWELCVALRPMSKLARWAQSFVAPPISRPDVTEPVMRAAHQRFVAQALQHLHSAHV